jgi:formate dehydrogenase subunit delta
MNVDRLVQMANDIANFFGAEPDRVEAAAGVAAHLTRFWDPSMRRGIAAYVEAGGAGLSPLARAGVERMASTSQM